MSSELYIPPGCSTLADLKDIPQIRLGLQGLPKIGKTWAALTFPNAIVLSIDRGLGAHIGREDVIEIPFWNPEFVDKIVPRYMNNKVLYAPNKSDAIPKWLQTEGQKLTAAQTLVIDGSTGLQNAFETEYNYHPLTTKGGAIDDFAPWRLKKAYFGELCELLKTLKCHVIYICHETPDRDKKGELNGLVRPLLTGQFGDELASHFTDWFRCLACEKPKTAERIKAFKEAFSLTDEGFKWWMEKSTTDTIYYWQTMSDNLAKCGTSSLVNAPKYILADYSSFQNYQRKVN